MNTTIDIKKLENFLWYLQNKSADVYETETKQAVERFLEEVKHT